MNHLAPFLLTNLLLERITASAPARTMVAIGNPWCPRLALDLTFSLKDECPANFIVMGRPQEYL